MEQLRRLDVVELEIGFAGSPRILADLAGVENLDTTRQQHHLFSYRGDLTVRLPGWLERPRQGSNLRPAVWE
ncbi:MAG: hypothetical protein WCC60_20220 [Ilumatobacteraceae bacterium]